MSSYGDTASAIGNIDDPSYDRLRGSLVVYDPRFNTRQTQLFRDWGQNRKAWKSDFADFKSDFNAATPEVTERTRRDIDYFDAIAKGDLGTQLSGLRDRNFAADSDAYRIKEKNALDFADNQNNFFSLASGLGGGRTSSADYARRIASGRRAEELIGPTAEQARLGRERSDFGFETGLKLSTAGQGNRMLDDLIARKLKPSQMNTAQISQMIGMLNAIGSGTPFGAQPEFHVKANDYDKVGQWIDVGTSIYGGVAGSTPAANGALNTGTGSTGGGSSYGSGYGG